MRKKSLIGGIFILFVLSYSLAGVACAAQWAKAYGYGNYTDETAYSVQQTIDGGFIVAGLKKTSGSSSYRYWIVKLTAEGVIEWEKDYIKGANVPFNIELIDRDGDGKKDDGYIFAGVSDFFGDFGWTDLWLVRLGLTGDIKSQGYTGDEGVDQGRFIQQTSDRKYIIVGNTKSFDVDEIDIWVYRLDPDSGTSWQETIGGAQEDKAVSVRETSDKGYIIAAQSNSFGSSSLDWDYWIIKLNQDGNVQWHKTYGGDKTEYVSSIQQTADGGYIVAGYSSSFTTSFNGWIIKLDAQGAIQWQKVYTGAYRAYSIDQTSDGGYIVAGTSTDMDALIMKLYSDGTIEWQKTYGGSSHEEAHAIQQTGDGGYIAAGYTESFGEGGGTSSPNFWVLKIDHNGEIPDCSAMGTPGVTASDTSITPGTPTEINVQSVATEWRDTSITPADTEVAASEVCYHKGQTTGFLPAVNMLLAD
ncbi:MAG: hypothetical protein JRJ12_00335 [Deltaproteobacteria bacterium]|nr:hypothetical protein [Deltaproteobacteria bacterium]MBW2069812.1 hypothetical protein [Deltaproteobacteria bacterium]